MSGAWSTGEFGTMLLSLFAPQTAAEFRLRRRSTVAGVENPGLRFRGRPAALELARAGGVAIDGARLQGIGLDRARDRQGAAPRDEGGGFRRGFRKTRSNRRWTYDSVMIGGKKFLLPVHAETLACERGTSNCSRSAIDFRNYHKFESNSDITFEADK